MASSDSESDYDSEAYQTTKVLLGYASREPTEDTISIIGGSPSWLDAAAPPSAAHARCQVCHAFMAQLLQLHADLPEKFPTHERRLHVFACRRRTCARKDGSVRALRTTRLAPSAPPAPAPPREASPPRNLGGAIFGAGSSGQLFGAPPSFAARASVPPSSGAENAVITHGPALPLEPWPAEGERARPYPAFYLDAEYEELDRGFGLESAKRAGMEAAGTSSAGGGGGADEEAFESSLDRTFQRFADRLSQNPEQVLRYEFKGTPLLSTREDAVGRLLEPHAGAGGIATLSLGSRMPTCARCGTERVFEVQLVPHAIAELEVDDEVDGGGRKEPAGAAAATVLEGMEWSTIVVGVCARDCAGAPGECVYVEEWAGVQWEEAGRS